MTTQPDDAQALAELLRLGARTQRAGRMLDAPPSEACATGGTGSWLLEV